MLMGEPRIGMKEGLDPGSLKLESDRYKRKLRIKPAMTLNFPVVIPDLIRERINQKGIVIKGDCGSGPQ